MIEHIVRITRLFENFLNLHPVFIGVLIHRFVVILLLYTNQYDSKRQLLCSLRNTVEEIVKSKTKRKGWDSNPRMLSHR